MQMETMLAFTQAGKGWCDHKSVPAVAGQNRADRLTNSVFGDAVDVNLQCLGLHLPWQQQGDAQGQQRGEKTH